MRSQRSTGSGGWRGESDRSTETDAVCHCTESAADRTKAGDCRCTARFYGAQLVVDAEACPGGGRLIDRPACRETVIGALAERDAVVVYTRIEDTERAYRREGAALLLAAGRFVSICERHDPTLAARARRDPLGAARLAVGRGSPIDRIAAETGLAAGAVRFRDYEAAFGNDSGRPSTRSGHASDRPDRA